MFAPPSWQVMQSCVLGSMPGAAGVAKRTSREGPRGRYSSVGKFLLAFRISFACQYQCGGQRHGKYQQHD
jgi:hypothetical protein